MITLLTTKAGGQTGAWQVETSGSTMLVVRRHRGVQQDLARHEGRIRWFESKDDAQKVADELNAKEKAE